MTGERAAPEKAHIRRLGADLLGDAEGLALLDTALRRDDPAPLLVPFRASSLAAMARDGSLPEILSGLVPTRPAHGGDTVDSLRRRLSGVAEADRPQAVLDVVREHVAEVLGRDAPAAVEARATFKDLGFDSLSAVELRNGLARATRLQLPATLAFDHPTPEAVAAYLLERLPHGGAAAPPTIERELERLERLVERLAQDRQARAGVELRMRAFNVRVQSLLASEDTTNGAPVADLDAASDEEMFALIDEEFGAA